MRQLWLAALLLSGCESAFSMLMSDPGDGGPPASTNGTNGGVFRPEAGVLGDSGTLSETGLIRLHSSASSLVSAVLGSDGCTAVDASGCTLFTCPSADLSAASSLIVANAGDIHITGGSFSITLLPSATGAYAPQTFDTPLWGPNGATLMVSAAGSDIPAFSSEVDGTTAVTIDSPILVGQNVDLPRAADFDLTWTGGTTGVVIAYVSVGPQMLACGLALAAGQGVLSHQALSMLQAGTGTLDLEVTSAVLSSLGIQVRAETPAVDVTNGQPFTVSATIH